jgi:nucleotidyltransferase/DNA polymerase involved in DNA repair
MSLQGSSPELFFDTINACQRTEALRSAIELDLFSLVGAGRRTAAGRAEACGAASRGVRILADYLTILGFLRKSVSAEATFGADLFTLDEARAALEPLIGKVWTYCEGSAIRGRTVTLKAK